MPHVFALSAPDLGNTIGPRGRARRPGDWQDADLGRHRRHRHHHHGGGWRHGGYHHRHVTIAHEVPAYYPEGPCGCSNFYDPVVGADTRIYQNACVAGCYGVPIRSKMVGDFGQAPGALADATSFFSSFGPVVGGAMVFGLSLLTGLAVSSVVVGIAGSKKGT